MSLSTEQEALNYIATIKSNADSNGITFHAEYINKLANDTVNTRDLLWTFGPFATTPNLTVIAAFEQYIDSDHHSGLV